MDWIIQLQLWEHYREQNVEDDWQWEWEKAFAYWWLIGSPRFYV